MLDHFWAVTYNYTEALGDAILDRMSFLGDENVMWLAMMFAVMPWVNNVRLWLRTKARESRARRLALEAAAEEKED